MKQITSIKQVSGNKYSLLIEGKKHIVYDDVLLQYNILKKGEISDEVYKAIISANNYHEAYNKMLKYISAKLRTEKEIRDKLNNYHINKIDQDKIVTRLRNEGYLNEEVYVKSYVNDSVSLTLNGPQKIVFDLKKLGFKEELIYQYINQVEEKVWYEKCDKIINKKLKTNRNLSEKMFIIKLKKDLQNLGYEEKYYVQLLSTLEIDDTEQMQKDYQKVYNKLSKKYSDVKLKMMIKQKMYQLGYDLDKLNNLID